MAADGEAGWQGRLLRAMCAPPIPRLRFAPRSEVSMKNMERLQKGAWGCVVLGLARSYFNQVGPLGDFMGGGTDLFSALLAMGAVFDVCLMNGSFLFMFVVWAMTNAVLFNITFSLLPNLFVNCSGYLGHGRFQAVCFLIDNVLIVLGSAFQFWLAWEALSTLNDSIPEWKNLISGSGGSSGSSGGSALQQPLMQAPPRQMAGGQQPQPRAAAGNAFQAFAGGGQKIASGGGSSGAAKAAAAAEARAAQASQARAAEGP